MSNMIQKAGGLLVKDRKVMLERHGGKDTYIVPGGKLEAGETAQQALVREFQEEFAITVSENDLEWIGSFESSAVHSPDKIVHIETFIIKKWDGEITLHDGIEDVAWINTKNMHDFKISPIAQNDIIPLLLKKGLIE